MHLLNLVSQQGQTLAQYTLQTGSTQRIAAVDNVHYQLANAQSGLAAQGVEAGRTGDDLLIHINGEPAVIIEDYFLLDSTGLKNPLLGLNGSGQYVAYPIGDASALAVEHLLAEEVAGVATASTTSAAAINPAIALASVAGIAVTGAAIAGSNKNDDNPADNQQQRQPQTPFDPNQPSPPVDNPPPGGGNNPPPGGGNNPPPGGGNNPPPGGGNTDTIPPTLAIRAAQTSLKPGDSTQITFELSEKVEGFDASDIVVNGGTLSNFSKVGDTIYTATFTAGTNPGNASLRVAGKAFKDTAGNDNQEASELALIIATAGNTAPDSEDKPVTLAEDSSHSFSAADFAFNDPDQGQTLQAVRIDSLPDTGMLILNGVAVTAGQIVAAADLNKLAYTPVENGNGDNYARFTFSVQDSEGTFDTRPNTITLDVTAVNDAPVAQNDVASTKAGTPVEIDVKANDSDVDSDPLTVSAPALKNPSQGSVEITPEGKIKFTPAQGITGLVEITYTVKDPDGASDTASVTVNVKAVSSPNTAPDSEDKPVTLAEDSSHSFSAADFAFNDPDQGQTLQAVRIDSLPDKGALTLSGVAVSAGQIVAAADLNKLAYTPVENGNGDNYARFTFSVQDSEGAFDESPNTITFNVTPVNDAPIAKNDVANTKAGEAVTVNVLENDSDVDGDSLTIMDPTLDNPAQGQVEIVGDQIRFTPAAGVSGDVAIRYSVSDGKGGSADATLTVTVDDELPPPTFTKGKETDHGSVTITPHVTALSMEGSYKQTPTQSYRFKIFRSSENDPWQFDSGVSNKEMMLLDPESGAITLVAGVVMGGGKVTASNSRSAEKSAEVHETADAAPDGKYLVSIVGANSASERESTKYYIVLNKPAEEKIGILAKVRHESTNSKDFDGPDAINAVFDVGKNIVEAIDEVQFKLSIDSGRISDPYEGNEIFHMDLTRESDSSAFGGSAFTTPDKLTINEKRSSVKTILIDALPYHQPKIFDHSGTIEIHAEQGAEKLSISYQNEQDQQQMIELVNKGDAGWEVEGALPSDVKLEFNIITLQAQAVKDGSTVTAWHSSSDGSREGERIEETAGSNPSPKILADALHSVHDGTDGDDVLIAPDIDLADYAALLAAPDALLQELDAQAENLLTQSAVDARHDFRGGAGNDIMISLNSADTLQGGEGADSFVFVADQEAMPVADQILDFHAGEDLIHLIGGQRDISNIRFDENTQTLHYQSGQDSDAHSHSIVIHGHNGLLQEVEVLNSLNIL